MFQHLLYDFGMNILDRTSTSYQQPIFNSHHSVSKGTRAPTSEPYKRFGR